MCFQAGAKYLLRARTREKRCTPAPFFHSDRRALFTVNISLHLGIFKAWILFFGTHSTFYRKILGYNGYFKRKVLYIYWYFRGLLSLEILEKRKEYQLRGTFKANKNERHQQKSHPLEMLNFLQIFPEKMANCLRERKVPGRTFFHEL